MKSKNTAVAIGTILFIIYIISKIGSAAERAQYKEDHPYPRVYLDCATCNSGIPIYDSWSTERAVDDYGRQGEECEVTSEYTTSYSLTLQPNASYEYIDFEPHLYVRCPSGHGFIYSSHAISK